MTENNNSSSSLEQNVAAEIGWVRTWGASPQSPDNSVMAVEPFGNATLRQIVRISNEYGTTPLRIGAAHVGLAESDGGIEAGSDRALTFGGQPTISVPAGAPILSDPVDLRVPGLSHVTISLYMPDRVETCTCHGPITHSAGSSRATRPRSRHCPQVPRHYRRKP